MRKLFDPPPEPWPGLIEPTAPRLRPDGERACSICGAPAFFGFAVSLRNGQPGRWACLAHREAVETMKGKRQ